MGNLEKIEKYWDTRSEGFSKRVRDELKTDHEKWSEKLDFYLKDIEGKRVLDIGCGPGFFTIILSEKGYDVTAFDYSPDMLKEAEKMLKTAVTTHDLYEAMHKIFLLKMNHLIL